MRKKNVNKIYKKMLLGNEKGGKKWTFKSKIFPFF